MRGRKLVPEKQILNRLKDFTTKRRTFSICCSICVSCPELSVSAPGGEWRKHEGHLLQVTHFVPVFLL